MSTTTVIFAKEMPKINRVSNKNSAIIKHCIQVAIDNELAPVLPSTQNIELKSYPVYLSSVEANEFQKEYIKFKTDYKTRAEWLSAMAISGMLSIEGQPNQSKQDAENSAGKEAKRAITLNKRSWRPEQLEILDNMDQCRAAAGNGIIEASTGSGKGLAIMGHANRVADQDNKVIIAAPTLNTLKQLHGEHEHIKQRKEVVMILGSQEYISSTLLENSRDLLSKDQRTLADEWSGKQNVLNERGWLKDSFEKLQLDIPAQNLVLNQGVLNADLVDGGVEAYRHQFELADTATIILATHSMLALDIRKRLASSSDNKLDYAEYDAQAKQKKRTGQKVNPYYQLDNRYRLEYEGEGILPNYRHLIVDEAHLLADSFASALSDRWCVRSLLKMLPGISKTKGYMSAADSVKRTLTKILNSPSKEDEQITPQNGATRAIYYGLEDAIPSLEKIKNQSKDLMLAYSAKTLAYQLRQVAQSSELFKPNYMYLTRSAVYNYPTINQSSPNVYRYLDYLWTRVEHGIAISATMLTPIQRTSTKDPSSFMKNKLKMPNAVAFKPIRAPWVTSDVSIYKTPTTLNDVGKRSWLQPPSKNNNEEFDSWIDEIATAVELIVPSRPQGGVLCLLTSYKQVEALHDRLVKISNDDVVYQKQDSKRSFTDQQIDFMEQVRDGQTVVLLATGKGWTGTNITFADLKPENDNALTTIIIPRLPFGMNRNPFQNTDGNSDYNSFHLQLCEMLLLFKQGIGRLVRRPGTRNKVIFLLDRRITKKSEFKYGKAVNALLADYDKVFEIKPELFN